MSIRSQFLTGRFWFVTLVVLVLVGLPSLAALVRIWMLLASTEITSDTKRFHNDIWPIVIHLICSAHFAVMGALQISASFRRKFKKWHRVSGRILVPSGLAVSISALWMTLLYDFPAIDGIALFWIRIFVSLGMLLCVLFGWLAIRERNYLRHGAFMMRAYALAMGAGTQIVIGGPVFAYFGEMPNVATRAILMGLGWLINLMIAEYIIFEMKHGRMRVV